MSAEPWAALARALALVPYVPIAQYEFGASFREMKRALGAPAHPPAHYEHWLHGTRGSGEIIVFTHQVDEGVWTYVAARIDPPLFLGLGIRPQGSLFGSPGIVVGDRAADNALHVEGFDGRVATLLSPQDPDGRDLLARTTAAVTSGLGVRVTDSVVLFSREGLIANPSTIGPIATAAATLASAFAARRLALPATPVEVAIQNEWTRFADGERFSFDAARMKIRGSAAGSMMEVGLETDGRLLRTSVSFHFPRNVGVAFSLARANASEFLPGRFDRDIRIGDARFLVSGRPEAIVNELLARPAIVLLLRELGDKCKTVRMNHAQLSFRVEGAVTSAAQLFSLAQVGKLATESLFREAEAIGPYR